jgi:uncharacterized membrane protein YgdD (TMEM256/DUF423 family)
VRSFIVLAGILGFLAVALGAFGAHGLEKVVEPRLLEVWHTGVQYQMYHSLALLAVALLAVSYIKPAIAKWAGWAFVIGILLFSGSLYTIVLLGVRNLGLITPIGGVFFLIGWVLIVVAALKK